MFPWTQSLPPALVVTPDDEHDVRALSADWQ